MVHKLENIISRLVQYFTLQFLIYVLFVFGGMLATYVVLDYQRGIDKKHVKEAQIALIQTQIYSCERGNNLRKKVNNGFGTIRGFILVAAVHAHERAMKETGAAKEADLQGEHDYNTIAKSLQNIPLTQCKIVIERTNAIINKSN